MEYGGYLPFETNLIQNKHYFDQYEDFSYLKVNCGRTAFLVAAKCMGAKKIWLPIFNCADTRTPFDDLGIEVQFYKLNENLLPNVEKLADDEAILWTNYYGNASIDDLIHVTEKFKNKLIVDNCHAFFATPLKNAWNCYSCRKFFGVADGGFLVYPNGWECVSPNLSVGDTAGNTHHLFQQIHSGTNSGYEANQNNEKRLAANYSQMSKITDSVLRCIDYAGIRKIRNTNIIAIHSYLQKLNKFEVNLTTADQMYYPFLYPDPQLRHYLVQKKIYNPQWWKHVLDEVVVEDIEYNLATNMIMLPIDQRYRENDMYKIANCVIELTQY